MNPIIIKRFLNKSYLCGILPFATNDLDKVSKDSKTAKSLIANHNETGWDRLYMMFSLDEFGVSSPELHSVFQSGFLGTTLGVIMGGIYRSRNTYRNFIERNQATVFRDHLEAKKKLQDQVTINFGKGAFYWGWRLGLFTSTYVLITTSISVYRGKSSILEYLAAGCITGSCFKMNMGVKGMVVGGLLGSALGGLAGGLSLAILNITGTSMDDVRYWQYKWKQERVKQEQKTFKTYEERKDFPLLKHHNEKIGPAGETLTALDSEPAVNTSH
uniref:Complex I assembly factor TIMMDC1, mitochondrial n=1 Tax=Timema douglasi TaxID=61478 RepID=A0A7R8VL89_TIMDO|nr:unnamed protein product [Timema douglasi]